MNIYQLQKVDFEKVVALGNVINGENYLTPELVEEMLGKSCRDGHNCSFVAYDGERSGTLAGFRLTYAPGSWEPDKWCCPEKWKVRPEELCYFKSNMIAEPFRGKGLGPLLLNESIRVARSLGALGGITHIWMQSPGNSAFKYFTKAGGELVMIHPGRWNEDCINYGYSCILCGTDCTCDAAEMILYFKE